MRVDIHGMDAPNSPAPRITTAHIRLALATRHGLVVQDLTTGTVYAAPAGLTKTELANPDLIVILTNSQAAWFLDHVGGNYSDAAKSATAVIAWEWQTVDARLAAWAAKAGAK